MTRAASLALVATLGLQSAACEPPPGASSTDDWQLPTRPCLEEADRFTGEEPLVYDLAWAPSGRQLVTGSANLLRLYSVDSQGQVSLVDTISSPTRFNSVQWSLDGGYVLAPSGEYLGIYRVTENGTLELAELGPLHPAYLQRVAVSPDETQLLSCDVVGVTRLYSLSLDPPSIRVLDELAVHDRCTRVAWSPSGRLGLSAGRGGALALYRILAQSLSLSDVHWAQEETGEAIFGRDDTEAIGGSFGSLNTLWYFAVDTVEGTLSVEQSLDFHQSGVGALEWSHSGDFLLTGDHDHSTHLLERKADELGLQRVSDQEDEGLGVHSARWSPDDHFIAQTSSNRDLLTIHELVPCPEPP